MKSKVAKASSIERDTEQYIEQDEEFTLVKKRKKKKNEAKNTRQISNIECEGEYSGDRTRVIDR